MYELIFHPDGGTEKAAVFLCGIANGAKAVFDLAKMKTTLSERKCSGLHLA